MLGSYFFLPFSDNAQDLFIPMNDERKKKKKVIKKKRECLQMVYTFDDLLEHFLLFVWKKLKSGDNR